jgi:hypothetical protein
MLPQEISLVINFFFVGPQPSFGMIKFHSCSVCIYNEPSISSAYLNLNLNFVRFKLISS